MTKKTYERIGFQQDQDLTMPLQGKQMYDRIRPLEQICIEFGGVELIVVESHRAEQSLVINYLVGQTHVYNRSTPNGTRGTIMTSLKGKIDKQLIKRFSEFYECKLKEDQDNTYKSLEDGSVTVFKYPINRP